MSVIYKLTLRQLLRGKRIVVLALIPLAPAAVAAAYGLSSNADKRNAYAGIIESIFLPIALAIVALILGASAIGDEREDATIVYIAVTPLARRTIVLAKVLAAWTAVTLLCVPTIAASLIFHLGSGAGASNVWRAIVAVVACGAAYVAVFALLSLYTRRPVLLGALYVVLWEGSIATYAPSADRLSISAYGRAIVAGGLSGAQRFNVPSSSTVESIVAARCAITVAAALYGGRRPSDRWSCRAGRALPVLALVAVTAGCGMGSSHHAATTATTPTQPPTAPTTTTPAPVGKPVLSRFKYDRLVPLNLADQRGHQPDLPPSRSTTSRTRARSAARCRRSWSCRLARAASRR